MGTCYFSVKMALVLVERVQNRLKMAGHLKVATIGSLGTVSNGDTSFLAEPELDSFFK